MTLEVLLYYHLCLSDSLAHNAASTSTPCASLQPVCSSKLHLAGAENQKKNIEYCAKVKNRCLSQSWDIYYIYYIISIASSCKPWLSICSGTVCYSVDRGMQRLVSEPQIWNCVFSWSMVDCTPSLKYKTCSNVKPEMNTRVGRGLI